MNEEQQKFLEYIKAKLKEKRTTRQPTFRMKEEVFFELRYDPERPLDYPDIRIAKELMPEDRRLSKENYYSAIGTTSGNVRKTIKGIYQKEMEADGLSFHKRKKGEDGAWQPIYNWLWNYKFPRWQVDKYWQLLQQKVKDFNFEWIRFVPPTEILETDRMMKASSSQPIKSKIPQKIPVNQQLLMSVDLPNKDSYLLLLNRGLNSRFFVCPSAVAADNHIVKTPIFLPLKGSELDRIEFSDMGKEEYLAIVLDRPLEVEWLQLNEEDPFPSCEPDRMMELWQQLEGRTDWRVYYEAFEVVEE